MFISKRLFSKPKKDPFSLADALGLLSPSRHAKPSPRYKPSLLQNLQNGSVAEQFQGLQQELDPEFRVLSVNHRELFDTLVADLHTVNALLAKTTPEKSLARHIRSLQDEDELLELLCRAYQEKKLTLALLSKFILNKNLKTLSRLPFDVSNLDCKALRENGWSSVNFVQFKILLLKKYHDLRCPLSIVRLLKGSFQSEFLPLIRKQALAPFYERIVWKFYFDFVGHSQLSNTISRLHNMRHSFLIWEACAHDSLLMSQVISKLHHYNKLQELFVQLASWCPAPVLPLTKKSPDAPPKPPAGYSKFLSSLKTISAKFKLYDCRDGDDVAARALAYSLIHNLESCVQTHYPKWKSDAFLNKYMESLRRTRSSLMLQGTCDTEAGSLVADAIRYV